MQTEGKTGTWGTLVKTNAKRRNTMPLLERERLSEALVNKKRRKSK